MTPEETGFYANHVAAMQQSKQDKWKNQLRPIGSQAAISTDLGAIDGC